MVIIRLLYAIWLIVILGFSYDACAEKIQVQATACEKLLQDDSKSTVRLRATDKATFLAVRNLKHIQEDALNLSDHDFNVMIYRLVDEHVEDLSVKTLNDEEDKVCVEVSGNILEQYIEKVREEFVDKKEKTSAAEQKEVAQVVKQIQEDVKIKPDNPENLALVYVKNLEYFNGSKSVKYAKLLKDHIDGNPYFYLTEDAEIADYIITPKVLKAKIDTLDAANKRLHMALVLEISGLEQEIVSQYQNRFVLFGAEENEQKIASRLISKLIEQAGDGAVRKIEQKQQQKLEKAVLGRTL